MAGLDRPARYGVSFDTESVVRSASDYGDIININRCELARGKKPIARLVPCRQLPNENRPEVGTITSKSLKILDKPKFAGSVGDEVLYF